jgi:elongation factor G
MIFHLNWPACRHSGRLLNTLELVCPDDLTGVILGDLQTRRSVVEGMNTEGHFTKILAKVPVAELHEYASALRSISQGRAKFNQHFNHYQAVPAELQNKLAEAYKKAASYEDA